jgi:uncharacterized protein (TIGR02266 family)
MSDSNKEADPADKRRFDREAVTLVVEYDGADDLVADYTENLSAGGTFVNTVHTFAPGTEVKLVLSFPGLVHPIALSGIVRWSRGSGGAENGVGIEFTEYDAEARARLDRLIDAINRRDPAMMTQLIKVLVVEDNPHVAKLIRDGLRGSGPRSFGDRLSFDFRTAGNGREAMDMLAAETFDALIIDIYLPVMDGPTVISQVRADERLRALPIIAVSAGGQSARDAALAAGADFFLDKPMRLRQVIETMRQLMNLED